jgi:hypothetical protein
LATLLATVRSPVELARRPVTAMESAVSRFMLPMAFCLLP